MSILFELGASLFDSMLWIWFISKANRVSFRLTGEKAFWKRFSPWWIALGAALLLFGITLVGDKFLPDFSTAINIVLLVIAVGYGLLTCRHKFFRGVFAAVLFDAILIFYSTILFYVFSYLFPSFDSILYGADNTGRYIYVLTHKVLLLATSVLILHFLDSDIKGNTLSAVLSFVFSGLTVCGLGLSLGVMDRVDASPIRYHLFGIALVLIALNILLYILLGRNSKLEKSNYELELKQTVSQFEEVRYRETMDSWTAAEKARHDMRHHLAVIDGLLEQGDTDGCRRYLTNTLDVVSKTGRFDYSGHPVVDCLLNAKLGSLDNTQIIVTGSPSGLSDISDTDLASLLGNVLDNAVEAEASVKEKRIELQFAMYNKSRMIICRNAIEGSVLNGNAELKTTKAQKQGHGYGHQIIGDIAAKYGGMVHYYEEDGMFGVQIVLPETNP